MKLPIYQVDAFTSRRFRGNPAAVVVMDEWLPDEVLRAVAAENNLSETAYVIPNAGDFPLRWFTPAIEVDLCGHATLATAHVLLRNYFSARAEIAFSTRSGRLSVERSGEILTMEFPSRPATPIEIDDALTAALGARPRETLQSRDLLAVFGSEEEVRALRPDFVRIAALETFAVIASAPGIDADFVSRFFAPKAGIPEDPVTGSAHCTLIPYWAAQLGRQRLMAKQVSARGGELRCELRGDRVKIGGAAVEYMRGEINVDA